ncbi:ABC transporter ATP-binding protein [Pseudogemmobacter sonorensis]|uniref:ABC transporter ATP-binding protein n=1 Tax=Pseudogemmobacter sonorensis TaxID=2989681 RepID=UPI0036982D7D
MTVPLLQTRDLAVGYGAAPVLSGITLKIAPGRITAIVGANACGKSTLLRSLARLLPPRRGSVTLDGVPVQRIAPRAFARRLGFLPQSPVAPEGITVLDLVSRGRHPHHGLFTRWSGADDAAVAHALEATGTADLAERDVTGLSGGQRQRVWIAMALAQETEILLLDEPTTFLDVSHQIEVLELLAALNRRRGTTVVMVLHELNLAARYADRILGIQDGGVHAVGTPDEVLTETHIREIFGLDSLVMPDPVSGRPMMVPRGALASARRRETR